MTEKKNPNISRAGWSSPGRTSKKLRSRLIDLDPCKVIGARTQSVPIVSATAVYHAARPSILVPGHSGEGFNQARGRSHSSICGSLPLKRGRRPSVESGELRKNSVFEKHGVR